MSRLRNSVKDELSMLLPKAYLSTRLLLLLLTSVRILSTTPLHKFCFPLNHKRKKKSLNLTSAVLIYPISLLPFIKTCPKSCPRQLLTISSFPFHSFKQIRSGLRVHHFAKIAFAKVTNDIHITNSYG